MGQGIGVLGPVNRMVYQPLTWTINNPQVPVIKMGTSSANFTSDADSYNFVQRYFKSTATTGDIRGEYLRLYISGAGSSGEAHRIFTTINNVAATTAHGAHISLNFATSGSLSGLGVASRCTLHIPDSASWTSGTLAAIQAEIYSDGTASDPDGVTALSFIRVVNDGHADGIADVDDDAFLFDFSGMTAGIGNMISAAGNEPTWTSATHKIRCRLPDGSACYLVAVLA